MARIMRLNTMAVQQVVWRTTTRLECIYCLPSDVIICIPPEKQVSGLHTIYGQLIHVVQKKNGCGSSEYTYTISFNDTQLIPSGFLNAADILGIVCEGCLTTYIKDQTGGEGLASYFCRAAPHIVFADTRTRHESTPVSQSALLYPFGMIPGDLLLVAVSTNAPADVTTTAPLTLITSVTNVAANTPNIRLYYRVWDGSEAPTALFIAGSGTFLWNFVALRIVGADPINPVDVISTNTPNTLAQSITIPAVTTTINNTLLLAYRSTTVDVTNRSHSPNVQMVPSEQFATAPLLDAAYAVLPDTGLAEDVSFDWIGNSLRTGVALAITPKLRPCCSDILGCVHVDPETISGNGTADDPFSVASSVLCQEVLDCITINPLTMSGAGTNTHPFSPLYGDPANAIYHYDDFTATPPYTGLGEGYGFSHMYTGGVIYNVTPPTLGAAGVVELDTQTEPDSMVTLSTSVANIPTASPGSQGPLRIEFKVVDIPTLSDSTDTYIIIIGAVDIVSSVSGAQNGMFFLYDSEGVFPGASGETYWQTVTAAAGNFTFNQGHTPITVSTNTPYKLGIRTNANGSWVFFDVDGVEIAWHAGGPSGGHIPQGVFVYVGAIIEKAAGTDPRQVLLDWGLFTRMFSNGR